MVGGFVAEIVRTVDLVVARQFAASAVHILRADLGAVAKKSVVAIGVADARRADPGLFIAVRAIPVTGIVVSVGLIAVCDGSVPVRQTLRYTD